MEVWKTILLSVSRTDSVRGQQSMKKFHLYDLLKALTSRSGGFRLWTPEALPGRVLGMWPSWPGQQSMKKFIYVHVCLFPRALRYHPRAAAKQQLLLTREPAQPRVESLPLVSYIQMISNDA